MHHQHIALIFPCTGLNKQILYIDSRVRGTSTVNLLRNVITLSKGTAIWAHRHLVCAHVHILYKHLGISLKFNMKNSLLLKTDIFDSYAMSDRPTPQESEQLRSSQTNIHRSDTNRRDHSVRAGSQENVGNGKGVN